jgi:hypothetical protein
MGYRGPSSSVSVSGDYVLKSGDSISGLLHILSSGYIQLSNVIGGEFFIDPEGLAPDSLSGLYFKNSDSSNLCIFTTDYVSAKTVDPFGDNSDTRLISGGIAQYINDVLSFSIFTPISVSSPKIVTFLDQAGSVLVSTTTSYANDAAAAIGGVPVGGAYNSGGTLKIRLV